MLSKKKKEKTLKNYCILTAICVITIILVVYLSMWYKNYRAYQDSIPVLRTVIPEITEPEVSHYVQENGQVVLYACVPSNQNCRIFEKDLKKMIVKKGLKDDLTYLNMENDAHASIMLKDLKEKYNIVEALDNYPVFIFFKDGEVKEIIKSNDNQNIALSEVEQFFDTFVTEKE